MRAFGKVTRDMESGRRFQQMEIYLKDSLSKVLSQAGE